MSEDQNATPGICGIIRPITDTDGYPRGHWDQVHSIVEEVAKEQGLQPKLVSEASEASIIHRTIVANLLDNAIIVCDVSALNANVMLELGIRLAVGKPIVIIKDDVTKYSFDTSPIEHVGYRADLRYFDIIDFKVRLGRKINATIKNYLPFLTSFGPIEVPTLDKVDVPALDLILSKIDALGRQITPSRPGPSRKLVNRENLDLAIPRQVESLKQANFIRDAVQNSYPDIKVDVSPRGVWLERNISKEDVDSIRISIVEPILNT